MPGPSALGATTRTRRPHWYVGAVALAWVVLYAAELLGPLEDWAFLFLAVGTAVSTVIGLRWWRPEPRWPWVTLFLAMTMFLVGGGLRVAYGTLGKLEDRSLVPDVVTLPGYVLVAATLAGMVRSRSRGRPRTHQLDVLLDGILASMAALAVAWIFLMTETIGNSNIPAEVRAVLSAYPPASVFLVAYGLRLAFMQGRRSAVSLRLLVAAVAFLLVGDVVYMLVETDSMARPGRFLDLPYAMSYVAVMVAVLHPSMRLVTEPAPADEASRPNARLALVAFALCVPSLVTLTYTEANPTDRVVLSAIILVMTATAALRMYRALRQHASSEERLSWQATHDQLTGLPNRVLVQQRLGQALARHETAVALLFIDIDRFKLVNDTMGHGMGDELLNAAARRLQATLRPHDLVGRGGGDEFHIVAHDVRDNADALEIAERTRLTFLTPFRIRDAEIAVSASIGVAVQLPSHQRASAETMFRDADTAMYQAKSTGGDAVALFDASVRVRIAERVRLERELRHALERDQLDVHFQPVVNAADGRVAGMEALMRWNHPWLGAVSPDVFIPIAEDSGLIVDMGAWILDKACEQVARLRTTFPRSANLYVSVNLSARQLRDDHLIEQVAQALVRHQLPAHALCLELTESLLMENIERTRALLTSLRAYGVRISIDDFGTGYSSLAYLKRLPVDEVKIDRSFVIDLAAGGADTSLVSAVVAIASSFGLTTVAEGVEDEAQALRLNELGCLKAQGYLFSRPVPALELPTAISRLGLTDDAAGKEPAPTESTDGPRTPGRRNGPGIIRSA